MLPNEYLYSGNRYTLGGHYLYFGIDDRFITQYEFKTDRAIIVPEELPSPEFNKNRSIKNALNYAFKLGQMNPNAIIEGFDIRLVEYTKWLRKITNKRQPRLSKKKFKEMWLKTIDYPDWAN